MTIANAPRRTINTRQQFERYAYLFMRLSGVALLVLAVGHVMINLVLVGAHNLSLQYVADQWRSWGWRVYDVFLLIFASMHGFNGLRNILEDYIHNESLMKKINIFLAVFLVLTILWSSYAILTFPIKG